VLSVVAYGVVIWALTRAPMAQVSALRETSVIMAALIGTRLLRERFGTRRVVAASLVAAGVVLLQIGRAV
jgi:drug/metabolite transporter (DMT)-like permease